VKKWGNNDSGDNNGEEGSSNSGAVAIASLVCAAFVMFGIAILGSSLTFYINWHRVPSLNTYLIGNGFMSFAALALTIAYILIIGPIIDDDTTIPTDDKAHKKNMAFMEVLISGMRRLVFFF
jgi:hypothetical protein